VHVTDATNASRTMLLDLESLEWDDELLELFGIEHAVLPRVGGSAEVLGEAELLGMTLPIAGIAGDQQAALAGHGCFERGEAKATYGTGSFVLVHAGAHREVAPAGLLETAAAPGGYALEGAILASGAALQWLRDGLGILGDAAESEALAREVESTGGVYFVPALTGLGSPHWRSDVRGLVAGITRGTTRAHLVRAALEAIAFQVADVLELFPSRLEVLRADGGASANGFLMQFQADLLGCPVEVATEQETTALGAAALAGSAIGLWPDDDAIRSRIRRGAVYEPSGDAAELDRLRAEWRQAVARALLT
jgi:glycerol kinase